MMTTRLKPPLDTYDDKTSAITVTCDDDLLREIFLQLPIRCLLIFKIVSKRWYSLISDPYFIRIHYLRKRPNLSGILLAPSKYGHEQHQFISLDTEVRKDPIRYLDFADNHSGTVIKQSCNGLLCCSSYVIINTCSFIVTIIPSYYIYNPFTQQYTTLPRPRGLTHSEIRCSVSLAYDPIKSPHYKVVFIWRSTDSLDRYQVDIYSSETRSWKLVEKAFTAHGCVISRSGVFWDGALHWISPGEPCLYLDVHKELFLTMAMPTIPHGEEVTQRGQQERWFEYFGASRYHMHLIERYGHINQLYFYKMENDSSGWSLKYRIDLDELKIVARNLNNWSHYAFTVMVVVEEEEEEELLILYTPKKTVSYNPKFKTLKKLKQLPSAPDGLIREFPVYPWSAYQWVLPFQYIETLSCV